MKKILLKTSIPHSNEDWNIMSFSLLTQQLTNLTDTTGERLFAVEARDRVTDSHGNDSDLTSLPAMKGLISEVWPWQKPPSIALLTTTSIPATVAHPCHRATRQRYAP
jgi:hypothetical protein